ncbi:DUF3616 domain-containing protein [Ancylobacter oerskovii]|uniref:DUF3616 domain-containing protein n=1 Tax=Ancylobacter oerskovii TaxID=459519 RepID=A0ABW4Z499_9HYPH|nr:DUF3616 domain-containing protein [Ancylobacter oerskovii]MBS7545770.1 DUF3616 domain-containing protein [Ancylobacter oerskovii]
MVAAWVRALRFGLLAVPLLVAGIAPSAADEADWPIEGRLFGKLESGGSKKLDFKTARDISGIACEDGNALPRLCVIADDEAQGVQIVMARRNEGVAGAFIPLISDRHAGEPLSLDAEGVAYADGAFYVIGSHGRPRRESDPAVANARAKATWRVFRIRFVPGSVSRSGDIRGPRPAIEVSTDLPAFLRAVSQLAGAFDGKLAEHGLNIEGVAVREGRLLAGLRAPTVEGRAAVVAVPLGSLFGGAPGKPELITYDLGKDTLGAPRGVRDLVAFGSGLLILAGPQLDPPAGRGVVYGDYAVYRTLPGDGAALVANLPAFGGEAKPEALLPLKHEGGALRAVLLFDGLREGGGRLVSFEIR